MIFGRWYRIGCKVFRFSQGATPECLDMEHGDYDGYGDVETFGVFTTAGYRDHWVMLADLCLQAAEKSKPLMKGTGLSRDEIRMARGGLGLAVEEAKDGMRKWALSMTDEDGGPEEYDAVYGLVRGDKQ